MTHNVSHAAYIFSAASLKSVHTTVKYEDPRIQLNLVQKVNKLKNLSDCRPILAATENLVQWVKCQTLRKELPSERPVIPSTKCERLAYYRAFTSSQAKTDIIVAQQQNINSFLWYYTLNVFFKSLPHGFVHYFLAAYAPEEHMFVTKMVPLSYGIKYLFIMVGFLEMISCVDLILVMFQYTIEGITTQSPWNRCSNLTYIDEKYNKTIICYEIQEFAKMFINKSHSIVGPYHVHNDTGEYFQVSQIAFYRIHKYFTESWGGENFGNFLLIWGLIQFLQVYARKRYFWKALHFSQWGINFVDLCTLAYLVIADLEPIPQIKTTKKTTLSSNGEWSIGEESEFWAEDVAMLAESVTAPPVVHVLTSRSSQEIDPTTDSTTMVISNALIYIFRGLLTANVKVFCEALVHTEMPATQFNEKSWFYLWPMFWQSFFLGDIYSILYTSFNMLCESMILVVTNLCITETVVYEWPKVKRWYVMATSTVVGILVKIFTTCHTRAILWIYGKGIATLAEVIFLYLWYPLGRLVDDYTFHYGLPPTRLKILSIQFVPIYYTFKIYLMINSLCKVMKTESVGEDHSHYVWSWSVLLMPIIVGAIFIMVKYLLKYNAPWSFMTRPKQKWGPRDFSIRQLRKQFDSRYYIDSEAPRLLSRYLLSKKETKVYKVDVGYEYQKKGTVIKTVGFGEVPDEKKEKKS